MPVKAKRWNGVTFGSEHGQFIALLQGFLQLFAAVLRHVALFLQQGNVLHGIADGVLARGVVHAPQEPFGVHKPNGRHVVGFFWIALDHEVVGHHMVNDRGIAGQELPLSLEAVVPRVAFNVFLKHLWRVVLGAQGKADDHDVPFVTVAEVGPQQLSGDLRHVRSIGAVKGREPHFAAKLVTGKGLSEVVGQLKVAHALGREGLAFHGAVHRVIRQGVEVVLREQPKKNQPRQRQGQHHCNENQSVLQHAHGQQVSAGC